MPVHRCLVRLLIALLPSAPARALSSSRWASERGRGHLAGHRLDRDGSFAHGSPRPTRRCPQPRGSRTRATWRAQVTHTAAEPLLRQVARLKGNEPEDTTEPRPRQRRTASLPKAHLAATGRNVPTELLCSNCGQFCRVPSVAHASLPSLSVRFPCAARGWHCHHKWESKRLAGATAARGERRPKGHSRGGSSR